MNSPSSTRVKSEGKLLNSTKKLSGTRILLNYPHGTKRNLDSQICREQFCCGLERSEIPKQGTRK